MGLVFQICGYLSRDSACMRIVKLAVKPVYIRPYSLTWRLSVAYIGPKSRTERLRKTKIGTEVAHFTRDSDTTFKVKRSKVNLQGAGAYCGGLPHSLLLLLLLLLLCVCVCVCAVRELVHCACETAGRVPGDHVTFGEFAVLVTELQELYRRHRSVSWHGPPGHCTGPHA